METCVNIWLKKILLSVTFSHTHIGGGEETNRTMIPSAVSLRIAETEQLYQAQRMIGGIGNVLLSTYSQTENG